LLYKRVKNKKGGVKGCCSKKHCADGENKRALSKLNIHAWAELFAVEKGCCEGIFHHINKQASKAHPSAIKSVLSHLALLFLCITVLRTRIFLIREAIFGALASSLPVSSAFMHAKRHKCFLIYALVCLYNN